MWQMQHGAGILAECDARVFLDAAGMMADELAEEMQGGAQATYGVPGFDSLRPGQRLRLLAEILTALLDESIALSVSTVFAHATVDAILNHVDEMLRLEVEYELLEGPHSEWDLSSWRRVIPVPTAGRGMRPPNIESVDLACWKNATDSLRERVLGKRERNPQTGVEAPRREEMPRATAGGQDCSPLVPSEPVAAELTELWRRLRARTHIESGAR